MPHPIRLDDRLVREAEAAAQSQSRTTPLQIKFWADLGKRVAESTSSSDIEAIMSGYVIIKAEALPTKAIEPADVFKMVSKRRADSSLSTSVSAAKVRYEASASDSGLLVKIQADGKRQSGYFKDGEFVLAK
ncbi:MAG: ParD-like family protein [Xanthomonadales bacterium]|nr:ParD-like family protein [Xanthomonadales bacterium]